MISQHSTLMGKITRSYQENEHLFNPKRGALTTQVHEQAYHTNHDSSSGPLCYALGSGRDLTKTARC